MGIASLLLGAENPFAQWTNQNQNLLGAIGAGLGQGQNIQSGLSAGLAMAPQAKQLDLAASEKLKAEKLAENQANATTNWIQSNYPQYAHLPPEQAWQAAMAAEKEKISGGGGVYDGTGMDAQNWNILLGGDPSTPEYEAAWAQITAPKMTLKETADGVVPVYEAPNIPASIRRPASMAQAAPATPPQQQPAPQSGGWGAPRPSFGGVAQAPAAPMGAPSGPSVGAPIPGTKPRPTEAQVRNTAIASVLASEVPKVGNNFRALTDPKGQVLSQLGALGNPWQSTEYQQAATALKSSISQILYSLSGATANDKEVDNQVNVLSPQWGDKPQQIADKLDRFKVLVRSVAAASGDAEAQKMVEEAIAALGPDGANNDPLGLRG